MLTTEKKPKFKFEHSSDKLRLAQRVFMGDFGGIPAINAFSGNYRIIGNIGYNGEKNPGEIGPIKSYFPDYESLRGRSWQLYLESELAQIVFGSYIKWAIGNGLKLESEPVKDLLKGKFDAQTFSKSVENRFALYSKSRISDYADMQNLNMLEAEAFKNALVGGDVLVILRYVDGEVKVELIDGAHVQSPPGNSDLWINPLANGNIIISGIEINSRKQHVAYYVRKNSYTFEFDRIPARGPDTNALMAFMVYGSKYRLDNFRGLPLLSVMFETVKKLERYKEATVGSAEERQKIAYAIEHDIYSDGSNPLMAATAIARGENFGGKDLIPRDDFGNALADRVTATTMKQAFNMPLGAHLKSLESKNELYFKEFYETNIMIFCAAIGIPYEVAMSKYDSNYSASRGAVKDWEHKLKVARNYFAFQFMQPIYDFWLEVQILKGNISAPGYLLARRDDDRMTMEAYRNARFIGDPVPHIDPEKEVNAERLKLGAAGAALPLTTVQRAIENLGGGDVDEVTEQFAEEMNKAKSLGIKEPEPKPAQGGSSAGK